VRVTLDWRDRRAGAREEDAASASDTIVRARSDPFFYIVDRELAVVSSSVRSKDDEFAAQTLPREVLDTAKRLLHGMTVVAGTLVATLSDETIMRLVPTAGAIPCYVIFIEPYRSRDAVGTAARQYRFTAREVDVLKLLMRGDSTDDIAVALSISSFTVLQHVKNIGQRMGLTRRREIVATLLGIR
jgi:DNA-binding CsgD family transcriptional regulator